MGVDCAMLTRVKLAAEPLKYDERVLRECGITARDVDLVLNLAESAWLAARERQLAAGARR